MLVFFETTKEISDCNASKWFKMLNAGMIWCRLASLAKFSYSAASRAAVQTWLSLPHKSKITVLTINEEKGKANEIRWTVLQLTLFRGCHGVWRVEFSKDKKIFPKGLHCKCFVSQLLMVSCTFSQLISSRSVSMSYFVFTSAKFLYGLVNFLFSQKKSKGLSFLRIFKTLYNTN